VAKIILFQGDFTIGGAGKAVMLTKTATFQDLNPIGFNDITSSAIVISGKWKLWEGNINDTLFASGEVTEHGGPDGDGVYPIGFLPIGNDKLSAAELL
jgi:hypothetical protein